MVSELRDAGASGTEESLIAAYGVHVITEIPRLDTETLCSYLGSFAILQWWLVDAHEVGAARKVSPDVDLYPKAYLKQVLSESESTMDGIFTHYLDHNVNRNRVLDLLPWIRARNDPGFRCGTRHPLAVVGVGDFNAIPRTTSGDVTGSRAVCLSSR